MRVYGNTKIVKLEKKKMEQLQSKVVNALQQEGGRMAKEEENSTDASTGGTQLSQIVSTDCVAITCYISNYETIGQ